LLANEGVDDEPRRAFLVYRFGHNRSMYQILAAT
jgi:hypothetical protein